MFNSAHGATNGFPNPAACEFWQRKMLTHFKRMDLNHDGYVSRDDVKALIRSLATNGELSERRSFLMQRLIIQLWEDFWCCGEDKGFDYLLPPEEFLNLMASLNRMPDCKKQLEEPLGLLFGIIDSDGNGLITSKEWIMYNTTVGVSTEDSQLSFEKCFDGKAEVTKADFITVGQNFFTLTDDRHPSKHLWGPLMD